ncbi:MAG TPA: TlpA disulfide reductase family protein [Verrucomicrobiae bacterium]|nr:TlpA disulfide reductase family protein [Verrucomicrobiae bacterium]
MRTFPYTIALLLVALSFSTGCQNSESQNQGAAKDAPFTPGPAPAWTLKDMDGKTVASTNFLGKVVLLDFWATWCPPCRQEIPGFINLQTKYGPEGLVVIGVDVGPEESSVVKDFMKSLGINYLVVAGDDKIDAAFGGIEGLPTTFVIDRAGQIVSRHMGFRPEMVFEAAIKPLLQK